MKRFLNLLVFLTLMAARATGFGQDDSFTCGFSPDVHGLTANMGTESGPTRCQMHLCDDPFNRNAAIYTANSNVLKIHLLVHLIRDNNGNGPTVQEVEAMLNKARNDFRGLTADSLSNAQNLGWPAGIHDTGIDFCWSLKIVDNSSLMNASSNIAASQLNEYPNHQVNVILSANPNSGGAQGTALGNPNGTNPNAHIWIHHSQVTGYHKTLSHELGHYFGLYHTFDYMGCGPCQENMLLSASQRDTMGDRCSDTDPSNSYNGCAAPAQIELCTGLPYTQQFLSNIMSYSWADCGVSFTPQQGGRMRCFLQTNYQAMLNYLQGGCPEIPLADFSANPSNSCPGTPIQFIDESWNAVGWLWDFGDGQTSTLQTPSHAYSQAGIYSVTLTVLSNTGLTHTKTYTNAVGITGGTPVPYTFSFNVNPSAQNGWTAQQDPRYTPDMAKWRRMSSLSFVPVAPVSGAINFTANTHSMGNGAYFYNNCFVPADPGLRRITGPNGVADTSCYFISSKTPLAGQFDALISPPFDLTTAQNPKMSFYFSHLPAGTDQPGMTCDWSFPGLTSASLPYGNPRNASSPNIQPGHPCYQTTCPANNPNCNRTNWGAGEILNDTLKVYVSTDCGATWTMIWTGNGEGLNTVPNEVCAPTVYCPRDVSVWRKLEFDLCPYINETNVQFKIAYVQDKFAGNMYVDEFFVGSAPGSSLALTTQAVPDCGLGSGSILAAGSGGTQPYSYGLSSTLMTQAQANATGTFQNLLAGQYSVSVQDAGGNCSKAPVQLGIVPALTTTVQVTGATCGSSNGSAAVTVLPGNATQYTYCLRNMFGQAVVPSSTNNGANFQLNGLAAGTYCLQLSDNLGNCGVDTIFIHVQNTLTPTVTAVADQCNSGSGAIVFGSPAGLGATYELRHIPTGQVFSNTTGVFNALMTGDYRACASFNGNCGCDTVTVAPGAPLVYLKSSQDETCLSQNGEIQVSLPNSVAGGSFNYELFKNGMLAQASTSPSNAHTFTGLDAGTYDVRVSEPQGGGCASFSQTIYQTNTAFIDVMPVSGWCGSFYGEMFVRNFLGTTLNYTITGPQGQVQSGTQSALQFSITGFAPGWYHVAMSDSSGACYADSVEIPWFTTLGYQTTPHDANCGVQDGSLDIDLGINGSSIYTLILTNADSSYIDTLTGSGTNFSFTGLAPGQYVVSGQDSSWNCFLASVTIESTVGCCNVPSADYQLFNTNSFAFAAMTNYAGLATGEEYHVVDTFHVNGDLNFYDCIFWMDSSAVIYIEPGYRLSLQNCQIKAACNYMWDGLVISHEKSVLDMDSCLVSDGENGIVSLLGGKYNISNTTLTNNWVSLAVKDHSIAHYGTIKSSTITSDPAIMMAPHGGEYAEVGIWVENVDSVNVGKSDAGSGNRIENVAVGIYSDRADLRVVNTTFSNIITKVSNKPVPFGNAYGIGIYASGLPGSAPAWIYKLSVGDADSSLASCAFEKMKYGIKAEANMDVLVEENAMERMMIGILLQKNQHNEMAVKGNLFTNCITGIRGLLYAGSGLDIESNIILSDAAHPGTGIMLSDVNVLNLAQAGHTAIKGNSIDAYGFGISATATAKLSIQQNDIRVNGNYPYFGWGAGINIAGCDSAQVTENMIESLAAFADSVSGIRSVISSQIKLSCNTLTACSEAMHFYGPNNLASINLNTIQGGRFGMVLENNGLIGNQGTGAVPAGNKWIGNWACTNQSAMILSKSTLAGQHLYFARSNSAERPSVSCNMASNGSAPRIVPVQTLKVASCQQPATITHAMARESWSEIMGGGRQYEVFANETRTLDQEFAASLVLKHGMDSVAGGQTLSPETLSDLDRMRNLEHLMAGNPAGLEVTQKSSMSNGVFAAGYDIVFSGLNYLWNVAPADVRMAELAESCPMTHGRAVFQARALQGLSTPDAIYDDGACTDSKSAQAEASPQAEAPVVQAFPNPTMEKISITTPSLGNLRIFSAAGELISEIELVSGTTTYDMAALPSGVYVMNYVLERGGRGTFKVVKI